MRESLTLFLQVASLALTGWFLWGARLSSRWGRFSVFDVVLRSAFYTLLACGAAAAITAIIYLTVRRYDREDMVRVTLRTSSAAVWFAPCIILLTALSPVAAVSAAIVVVAATRLLYHQWRAGHPPAPALSAPSDLFGYVLTPQPDFWREIAPALAASLSMQTAGVGWLLHKPLLTAAAFVMSVAIATVFAAAMWPPRHRPPQSLPRAVLGLVLTIVLAIGLTVGGMLPQWMRGDGSGVGMGTGAGNADTAKPTAKAKPSGTGDMPDFSQFPAPTLADGGFPGVILWPEVKPYATLIAPMPQRADGLGTVEARPLSIPFSGEYWMYRWPYARPPRTSLFQRGSPAQLSFKTTDRRAMQMEARHKVDQPIAIDCCSRIELAIRNADRFPNTISLELVLIDNEQPGEPFVSLGSQMVASAPDLSKEPIVPVGETLSFPVPSPAPMAAFNELKIVFSRDRRRADQSAKVAIDRFILIPR